MSKDDPIDSPVLRERFGEAMLEELREAQKARWRAEVRYQGALDHLSFYEQKARGLESELLQVRQAMGARAIELERHATGFEDALVRVNRDLEQIRESKAWRMVLRLRRMKNALPFTGR